MPSRRQRLLDKQRALREHQLQKSQKQARHPIESQRKTFERGQRWKRGILERDQALRTETEERTKAHRMHIADIDPEMRRSLRGGSSESFAEEPTSMFGFDTSAYDDRESQRQEYEREMLRREEEQYERERRSREGDTNDEELSDDEIADFLRGYESPSFKKTKRVRIAKGRDWIPTRETIRHVIKGRLKTLRLVTVRRTYPKNGSNPRLRILAETPIRKTLVTLSASWNPRTKTLSHLKRLSSFQKVKTVDEWHTHHRKSSGAKFLPCH